MGRIIINKYTIETVFGAFLNGSNFEHFAYLFPNLRLA